MTLFILDLRKKQPVKVQMMDQIKSKIAMNELPAGYTFDDIHTICKTYDVEIQDVEACFKQLIQDGYLIKINDTYQVKPFMLSYNFFEKILSIHDAISHSGFTPSYKVIRMKEVQTLPAFFLPAEKNESYLCIEKVYYANQTPIIYLESYYPMQYLADMPKELIASMPIYQYLHQEKHIDIIRTDRDLFAEPAPKSINKQLLQPENTTTIKMVSTAFDKENKAIEYAIGYASMRYAVYTRNTIHFEDEQ